MNDFELAVRYFFWDPQTEVRFVLRRAPNGEFLVNIADMPENPVDKYRMDRVQAEQSAAFIESALRGQAMVFGMLSISHAWEFIGTHFNAELEASRRMLQDVQGNTYIEWYRAEDDSVSYWYGSKEACLKRIEGEPPPDEDFHAITDNRRSYSNIVRD